MKRERIKQKERKKEERENEAESERDENTTKQTHTHTLTHTHTHTQAEYRDCSQCELPRGSGTQISCNTSQDTSLIKVNWRRKEREREKAEKQ